MEFFLKLTGGNFKKEILDCISVNYPFKMPGLRGEKILERKNN
jgi:hypothetical protein